LSHFHRKIYHNITKTIVFNPHFTSNFRAMHHVKIAVLMQNCTKSNAMCTEAFHWNHGGKNMQIYDYSVCVCKGKPLPLKRGKVQPEMETRWKLMVWNQIVEIKWKEYFSWNHYTKNTFKKSQTKFFTTYVILFN
jgi:hypothetical protein